MEKELDELRENIDNIDNQLLELLNERMKIVKKVGEIKHTSGGAIYRPEREKAIIDRLSKINNNKSLLNKSAIEALFLEIFAISRNLELPENIAYLGPEGSFTHQAAESRFGAMSEYLPMVSISSVFNAVQSKRAKFGVIPISNSTDGIVGETLDLLGTTDLHIVAELMMDIHHSFSSISEDLTKIKKIYSKDIAFGQCRRFLSEHTFNKNMEYIPVESTAKAAKMAKENEYSGAICSNVASKLYNIPVLFENIEDNHTNRTRFIIISDFENAKSGNDKTSILAKITDEVGGLVNFLKDFQNRNINLTKIESRPTKDKGDLTRWFYIDFEGHKDDKVIQEILQKYNNIIKWLGSYVKDIK